MTRRRNTELTVTERAAFIGWRLMTGDAWTTREVAALMEVSYQGADQLLQRASRIIPIYRNEAGKWKRLPESPDSTGC